MAIASGDILYKFSVKTGSAGDSVAGNAVGSLGKYISTTELTDASLHNLFDVITGDDNVASDIEYRGFFVHNNHATLTWEAPTVWLSAETAGGADIAIALDGVGVTPKGQATAQGDEIADEDTAPSGESFSSPTSKGAGLVMPNIPAGEVHQIWVRRTATNSAALDNDDVTFTVEGDTPA